MAEGTPLGDRKKEISGGTTERGGNGLSFLRPEVRLLLCCTRKDIEPRQKKEMEAYLQSPVDWTFLVKTAQEHGLLLFLYRGLWKNFADRVPKKILGLLQRTFLFNLRRNVLLTAELCKLLKLFEEEGIPTIPLKGPVLTVCLYGDLGMRPFSDLDLLFHKKDAPRAKALLVALGYQIPFSLPAAPKEVFLLGESEAALIREDGKAIVEILWGTPGDFPIPIDFTPFWEGLEKKLFEGRTVLTFSPENWVIYLCLHQATHGWNRLLWLSDLDALIRKHPGMDWVGLADRAKELHCRRVLFITLALMRKFLHTPLPQDIWQKVMADKIVQSMAQQRAGSLLKEPQVSCSTFAQALFLLRATDRSWDKIHFCYRQAMTPTVVDWLAWPLPRPLFFLYHFFHPLRVAGNYFRRFLKRVYSSLPFLKAEIYPIQKSS